MTIRHRREWIHTKSRDCLWGLWRTIESKLIHQQKSCKHAFVLHNAHKKCAFFLASIRTIRIKRSLISQCCFPGLWLNLVLLRYQIILWVITNLSLDEVAAVAILLIHLFKENKWEKTERPLFKGSTPLNNKTILKCKPLDFQRFFLKHYIFLQWWNTKKKKKNNHDTIDFEHIQTHLNLFFLR